MRRLLQVRGRPCGGSRCGYWLAGWGGRCTEISGVAEWKAEMQTVPRIGITKTARPLGVTRWHTTTKWRLPYIVSQKPKPKQFDQDESR